LLTDNYLRAGRKCGLETARIADAAIVGGGDRSDYEYVMHQTGMDFPNPLGRNKRE
jgi:hypothetical protein